MIQQLSQTDPPPRVVAVCISSGGVPKLPIPFGTITASGVQGDAHAHAKHIRPDRAISILDVEIIRQLNAEGFAIRPGTTGENLSVEGLHVQQMQPGDLLRIGQVVLRLEEPRKPCFVLDAIDPRLKHEIVGRCGYMASVVRGGTIRPGMTIHCHAAAPAMAADRDEKIIDGAVALSHFLKKGTLR